MVQHLHLNHLEPGQFVPRYAVIYLFICYFSHQTHFDVNLIASFYILFIFCLSPIFVFALFTFYLLRVREVVAILHCM